jgi:hypothetical protein
MRMSITIRRRRPCEWCAARLTSRRLSCAHNNVWMPDGTLCLDLTYASTSGTAQDDLEKYIELYCPKPPFENADQFFSSAPPNQVIAALEAICRRFGSLAAPCQAMVSALEQEDR